MSQAEGLIDAGLRTPRTAAVAGVIFSLLTLTSFGLLWSAIPANPQAPGGWLAANTAEVALALNLILFAGIAFLRFIGVIRDRLGAREDRFFRRRGDRRRHASRVQRQPSCVRLACVSLCEDAFVQHRQRLYG